MEQNKMQKNIGIALGIIVMLGVLFVTIFWGKQMSGTQTYQNPSPVTVTKNPVTKTPSTTPPVTTGTPSYTLAQVATHNNASNCWSIVGANVYDLTKWIYAHPGGSQAILGMCGKDATSAFENQHGGERRPANELAGLEIGTYKK
jgi:cytochrome b involved in lipid metabolism